MLKTSWIPRENYKVRWNRHIMQILKIPSTWLMFPIVVKVTSQCLHNYSANIYWVTYILQASPWLLRMPRWWKHGFLWSIPRVRPLSWHVLPPFPCQCLQPYWTIRVCGLTQLFQTQRICKHFPLGECLFCLPGKHFFFKSQDFWLPRHYYCHYFICSYIAFTTIVILTTLQHNPIAPLSDSL